MRLWAACLIAAVGAAVGATACDVRVADDGVSVGMSAGRAEDEWVRTYSLPPDGRLEIVNTNGPIEVSGSPGPDVEVRVRIAARAGSDEAAREALKAIDIEEEVASEQVAIEVRSSRQADARPSGRRGRVTVQIQVLLPPGLVTAVRTQNGPIGLDHINGRITALTSNGSITGSGLQGGVSASVGNGGVRLNFVAVDHPTDVTVLNGGIRLELPTAIAVTLDASALNGRITVDDSFGLPPESRGEFGLRGRVAGPINGGGPTITLQSTNGAVRVTERGAAASRSSR